MELIEQIKNILPLLVELIFTLIGVWVTAKVLPWLLELRQYGKIRQFVMAAEKVAEAGTIPKVDKNIYVLDLMEQAGIPVNPITKALVEAAVKEVDCLVEKTADWIIEHEAVPAEPE